MLSNLLDRLILDQRTTLTFKVDRGEEKVISIYRYTIIMVVNGTTSIPLLHI